MKMPMHLYTTLELVGAYTVHTHIYHALIDMNWSFVVPLVLSLATQILYYLQPFLHAIHYCELCIIPLD